MNAFELTAPSKWSTGLGETIGVVCCITWCLPCITFGQIAEMVDGEEKSCARNCIYYGILFICQCHCLLGAAYRGKLRAKYGLPAEPCDDFCVHCFFGLCALCQEYEELKSRGLDPSKGWIPPPFPAAPPMPPSMFR